MGVGLFAVGVELKMEIVKIWLAVPVGPPEAGIFDAQRGDFFWREGNSTRFLWF